MLLAEAERASLVLERGYRAWVQDRRSRFLLHRKDLAEVLRFKSQIRWGKEEADKREFVRLSMWLRKAQRLALIGATLALLILVQGLAEYSQKRDYQSMLEAWGLPRDLYDHLGQLEEMTLPGTVSRLDWLSSATRLKRLRVEYGKLASLEGLPAGLETLTLGASRLSDLEGLPAGLETLTLGYSSLLDLRGMPPSLTSLTLDASSIEKITGLPAGLRYLDLYLGGKDDPVALDKLRRSLDSLHILMPEKFETSDFRGYERLQSLTLHTRFYGEEFAFHLPAGLRALELDSFGLASFNDFPSSLKSLSITGDWESLPSLLNLPQTLETLEIDSSRWVNPELEIDVSHLRMLRSFSLKLSMSELPPEWRSGVWLRRLPEGLESLRVVSCWVVLSEQLPRNLKALEIRGRILGVGRSETLIPSKLSPSENRVSDLRFPRGFKSLTLAWLPLRLPEALKRLKAPGLQSVSLPAGLQSLDLSQDFYDYRDFSELPKLPAGLTELNLRGTRVRELPDNLRRLTRLDIADTPIDSLEGLPPSLKSLSLGTRQVETLEGLPDSVTALHFHELPISPLRVSSSPNW